MKIQDRTDNSVICNVHPLLADEVLQRCGGDKYRLQWISPFQAVVWNPGQHHDIEKLRRAAGDAWVPWNRK